MCIDVCSEICYVPGQKAKQLEIQLLTLQTHLTQAHERIAAMEREAQFAELSDTDKVSHALLPHMFDPI